MDLSFWWKNTLETTFLQPDKVEVFIGLQRLTTTL